MVDLNRLALLVVKPDGVAQRLTGEILAWLGKRGFRPLALRELRLAPERRSRLYATTRTAGRLDWELNAVLYALGPVHAVILESTPVPGWPSAADRLSRGLKATPVPGVPRGVGRRGCKHPRRPEYGNRR